MFEQLDFDIWEYIKKINHRIVLFKQTQKKKRTQVLSYHSEER
jgi:hypothetical protein